MAAAAEEQSTHPLALAILDKVRRNGWKIPKHRDTNVHVARGIETMVGRSKVRVGSRRFMEENSIDVSIAQEKISHHARRGENLVYVARGKQLLGMVGRQAALAIRNAQLFAAEQRVDQLSVVLEISREITSTLDLQRILGATVNLPSPHILYDRSLIGITDPDHTSVQAVSGVEAVSRRDADLALIEQLMHRIASMTQDLFVTRSGDDIQGAPPDLVEQFKDYFELQYGPQALAEPPRSGFTLAVWILPVLAVVIGAFFFIRYLRGQRAGAEGVAVATADGGTAALDPPAEEPAPEDDYRARIESELREM